MTSYIIGLNMNVNAGGWTDGQTDRQTDRRTDGWIWYVHLLVMINHPRAIGTYV